MNMTTPSIAKKASEIAKNGSAWRVAADFPVAVALGVCVTVAVFDTEPLVRVDDGPKRLRLVLWGEPVPSSTLKEQP